MRSTACLLSAALLLAPGGPARGASPARPAILLFLADDLGYADCSPFGGQGIRTPNMARLAAAGMRFTHAFVASPSCAPSRAALLASSGEHHTHVDKGSHDSDGRG